MKNFITSFAISFAILFVACTRPANCTECGYTANAAVIIRFASGRQLSGTTDDRGCVTYRQNADGTCDATVTEPLRN